MKPPHLLQVEEGPERFAPVFAAAREAGLRLGWLELPDTPAAPLPAPLESAAALGALRAVAVGGGRSVAVKPLLGPPVLGDLLREHFRGCAAVLYRGAVAVLTPKLTLDDEGLRVVFPGGVARGYTLGELVAALRRPRPFG
ncbi:MAG TPA: hypothetical protein VMM92_03165 [Thermoanaerobaculia bacterium]|nr:hypothetical protein [Thermoanaerobaculia bacterium]